MMEIVKRLGIVFFERFVIIRSLLNAASPTVCLPYNVSYPIYPKFETGNPNELSVRWAGIESA